MIAKVWLGASWPEQRTCGGPKASILDEVDFELELIRRDNINVAYILALLGSISAAGDDEEAVAKRHVPAQSCPRHPRLRRASP